MALLEALDAGAGALHTVGAFCTAEPRRREGGGLLKVVKVVQGGRWAVV